jgi:hypothetical protein
MQTVLSGPAQVTNSLVPSGERAKPDDGSGISIEETFLLARSKQKTLLAVPPAMKRLWSVIARAVGEKKIEEDAPAQIAVQAASVKQNNCDPSFMQK